MKKKTKATTRLLSLLLMIDMVLTTPGIPALAETVTKASTLANPVHNCTKKNDGTDTTDWSYVYFGSYPQTEVTGAALTTAITGASYDANGDTWVNGTKYRRISKSDTNNSGYFGDSTYRYFKWERIKWRVLQNDGSTLFVVADKGIDSKEYNEEYTNVTWENCTLRDWLNGSFYSTAFSSSEQGAIMEWTVVNEDSPYYGTEGGNNTRDKVYLLSIGEVTDPTYGFCKDYSIYSASRELKPSDYAHARGDYDNTSAGYTGNCRWWLRSPGKYTNYVAIVDFLSYVYRYGFDVDHDNVAVMPALHINLSSGLGSTVDDGSSGSGGSGETERGEQQQNVQVGTTFKAGNFQYKITKISGKNSTVTLLKGSKKSLKKLTIPGTVKYKGTKYKVTAIGNNAFKKYNKLKTVVIGKNVTIIGKSAFQECKNIKTITIKSKAIKKVGNKAFYGIKSSAKIKVGSTKMLKKYKKVFHKKALGKVKLVK